MINLQVDEGYAFDYLSILFVKKNKNTETNNIKSWQNCFEYLKHQINNTELWNKIIESEEMKQIIDANEKTFEAVEKARYGEISAKQVDDCNMERYNAKVRLQNKFFPNSLIIEKKS